MEARTGVPEREWDLAYGRMLQTFVTAEEHPTLARIVREDAFASYAEPEDEWLGADFEFGIERVLDGIAAYVEQRHGSPSPG